MAAPSAPPAGDPVLLTQWLFGLGVVLLYARDRFRGPEPLRGTTTFARYWDGADRLLRLAADDHLAHPRRSRGELRRAEACGLARVLAAVQWVTLDLLRQTDPRVPWMAHAWRMVPMAAALGAALGLLVPHFYRTRQRQEAGALAATPVHRLAQG